MARTVSIAHSKSILDRQRHVMSVGLENQALLHYDIDSDDTLNRYSNLNSLLMPDKWEFISGSEANVEVKNDGSIMVSGVTGTFTIVSKDYIEIFPDENYYITIALLNVNDTDDSHRAFVGTVDYATLAGDALDRGAGIYDNWVINDEAVPFNDPGTNRIQWQVYNNKEINPPNQYKSGESDNPAYLHMWPTGTLYARIFIKLTNLVSTDQLMVRNLITAFVDDQEEHHYLTPKTFLIDANAGKFGGTIEIAEQTENLVWNGNLQYGAEGWSVGTGGSGSVLTGIDGDGSYKVYFSQIYNIKNIVQVDMPNAIEDEKEYTLSFYARATKPMGFRRSQIIKSTTGAAGWSADQIIYINNTWQKIVTTATSSNVATSDYTRLVITEPDLLEAESLFIYYNGILLSRTTDFTEVDDYHLEFNFPMRDIDIINVFTRSTSDYVFTVYKITFHSAVPSGNKVQIRHIAHSTTPETMTGIEEIYEIVTPTSTIKTGNYVANTFDYMHVFRNGQLLEEDVDYTTAVETGVIRINFSYSLAVEDVIKIIFWKNMSMTRYEYTAGDNQTDFDLPTGVTYANDKEHLIVSENGAIQSVGDPAGINWTQQTSSFDTTNIQAVAHNGSDLWVAVGGSKIGSSPDGINWIQRDNPVATTWNAVAHNQSNLWVTVGLTGKLATSPDGIDWTEQTSSFGTTNICDVAYGSNYWVAVGYDGQLATSPNGIDWTQRTSSFGTNHIEGVNHNHLTGGSALWVAVGQFGDLATATDPTGTWTQRESYFGASTIYGVAHNGLTGGSGLWVAVGASGKLISSADGMTWGTRTSSFGTSYILDVAHDGSNLWVAVAFNGKLATSPNGIDWTQKDSSFEGVKIYGVAHNQLDLWVIVGLGAKIATSSATEDYIEIDNNTIQFNSGRTTGSNISIMVIDSPYKVTVDTWNLESNKSQFAFTPEEGNIFRLTTINGVAMSKDYGLLVNDYIENSYSGADAFDYERYDIPAASAGQTEFSVPGGYEVIDDLNVYRNGVLLTVTDDYTRDEANNKIVLNVATILGELITIFKIMYIAGTGPGAKRYVREDYVLEEGITSYNTAQSYGIGDNSLQIFINGVLQRKDTDYTETDTDTFAITAPFSSGATLIALIAVPAGAEITSLYFEEKFYGSDADTNNVIETTNLLDYVQETSGTVWVKDVKVEEGKPHKDAYMSGKLIACNPEYAIDMDERESAISFYLKPYAIDLQAEGIIDFKGEVANYAALPGGASVGDVYRTIDSYKYYKWSGSQWDETMGPTALTSLYNDGWSLLKIERVLGETDQFRAIIGEPNNYTLLTLPVLTTDDWTMITMTWSLLGVQFYQIEVATFADLPELTANEEGYVYKTRDTGNYYIWLDGHWMSKAPYDTYNKYTELPALTVLEDGYTAYVDQEPELFKGDVADYASLPIGYTVNQTGWIYKTIDTGYYYVWNWDYVISSGKWCRITPGYYYQWNFDPINQSGNWQQSNKIKIYLNGGNDGIYTKDYRSVASAPNKLLLNNNLFGKVDELRIDKITRDPREIMTWYKSQEPFYPRGFKGI